MKMEQIECSETSAYKIQTPKNYPEESMQYYLLLQTRPTKIFIFALKIAAINIILTIRFLIILHLLGKVVDIIYCIRGSID